MLSIKDLSKMTNAQLQGELKKRGLAEVGKKAELVERLSDAIRKEEEDAILNADGDITGDADLSAAEAALLNEPEPEAEEAASVSPVPAESVEGEKTEATATEEQEKPAAVDEAPKRKSTEESADAKLKRAQRFGLPIGVPAATSVEAKQKRAERFGITPTAASDDNKATSDDAKAKRAERFGIVAGEKTEKNGKEMGAEAKAARAARFGLNAGGAENTEKKEKLLARAQRFGIPVSADGKVIAKQGPVDPEIEAKKKARAERFGIQQQ